MGSEERQGQPHGQMQRPHFRLPALIGEGACRMEGEKMKHRNVELLAPAGSYESMRAAVNAGADAVYIGGNRFGARAYAKNLDEEDMVRAIEFVHLHHCLIYMTVNTLVKEQELSGLYEYLKPYYEAGLDAVLVQDLGVFSYIRRQFPDLPVHVSTQMTVTGKYSARALKEMGACRVVPARELSLEEIREIAEDTGMEVETFVHGALCYCYSGQCLFSSLIGGRSGNRGRCAQTCRLPFEAERDRKTISKKKESYLLSLKDLCTLELLPDILDAGVVSLKIEGRMKSPRYTAGVVSIYRKYVDLYQKEGRAGYRVDPEDKKRLLDLFDRGGQTRGYYEQHNGRDMVVLKEKPAFREGNQVYFDFLDETYTAQDKKIPVRGTGYFAVGKPARLTLEWEGETGGLRKNQAPAGMKDGGQDPEKEPAGVPDRSEKNPEKEPAGVPDRNGKEPEKVYAGAPDWSGKRKTAEFLFVRKEGECVQEAKNAPMDEERIRKQLLKTGDSPFEFQELHVYVEGNVFLPVQELNRLRREALSELEQAILSRYRRVAPEKLPDEEAAKEAACKDAAKKAVGKDTAKEAAGADAAKETAGEHAAEEIAGKNTVLRQEKWNEGEQKPEISVLASTRDQFEATLPVLSAWSGQKGRTCSVYLASESFSAGSWKAAVSACHERGIRCYLMLPRIFRKEAEVYFLKNRQAFLEAGFDAAGVGSMEEPGFFKEYAPELPLYFDHGMYCWNHLAGQAMKGYGADRVTLPVELNQRELLETGIRGELIVYGYLPMMVSAQCIRKTTEGCTGKPELLYLKDRKGKRFPVMNQCRFCYNTIYNCEPLSLFGLSAQTEELKAAALRLNFTVEDGEQTRRILDVFDDEFVSCTGNSTFPGAYTRGHFRRGAE